MNRIVPVSPGNNLWEPLAVYAEQCSWKAGAELAALMRKNDAFTDWERVFVALEGDEIAGFCSLVKNDCIPDLPYTPYISFIFVDESFRGKRLSEKLCGAAMVYAKRVGFDRVYLISDHVNLYEKFGFDRIDEKEAPWGAIETVFMQLV